ncbi:MAG: hypothetical protein OEQ12_03165 [Nitrosopumilus sp.]|nr:hypothetical protein [Nitrosopumilus sp.]
MDSKQNTGELSEKLASFGAELSKIQYDFKIKNTTSEKYWSKRIKEFNNYHQKVVEYFTQVYSLMGLANEEQAGLFLLKLSKLKRFGVKLSESMKKIQQNPSAMNMKDTPQSKWSIELREGLIKSNQDCLNHEKHMNVFFRDFYEKNLKTK